VTLFQDRDLGAGDVVLLQDSFREGGGNRSFNAKAIKRRMV
jgi:hypothetical protein